MKKYLRRYLYGIIGLGATGLFAVSYVALPNSFALDYVVEETSQPDAVLAGDAAKPEPPVDTREVIAHMPLPLQVKAIYMTSCVAGELGFRNSLVALIEETELNSVVIDIKDYSGTISFPPTSPAWMPAWEQARCGTADMQAFIAELHEKGIYVIGRITVFQDPFYTKIRPDLAVKKASDGSVWQDYKKLSFIDVGAKEYWDHIVELSVMAYNIGFDELNFDYVRYPSDGPMSDIAFPHSAASEHGGDKQANLEAFFAYLNEKLDDETLYSMMRHEHTGRASATPWTSVDLFGMTTTNTDDLSIGQIQERAAPYFDFVAPMVYPSHYPNSFLGLGNPNLYPYKVVNYAMSEGVRRMTSSTTVVEGFLHTPIMETNASGTETFTGSYQKPVYSADKFRTWIQDFDYGGDYDAADVRAEIQASYDAGVMDFMIWDPGNTYTRAALKGPGTLEVTNSSTSSSTVES